jgi:hypothetical protein
LNGLNETGREIKNLGDSAMGYQIIRDVVSSVRYVCEHINVLSGVSNYFKNNFCPLINILKVFGGPKGHLFPSFPVVNPVNAAPQNVGPNCPRPRPSATQKPADGQKQNSQFLNIPISRLNDLEKMTEITNKLLNNAASLHGVGDLSHTPPKSHDSNLSTPEISNTDEDNHVDSKSNNETTVKPPAHPSVNFDDALAPVFNTALDIFSQLQTQMQESNTNH